MKYHVTPTNNEKIMREDDFIVSKTDLKGIINYANRIFMEFAGYTEKDLLGKQHNIIRHPEMPRAVFKLLWDTIKSGNEIFAYVKNMAADGSFYWVFANVTPVVDSSGTIVGYYSVRRKPRRDILPFISDLYKKMVEQEKLVGTKDGIEASTKILTDLLNQKKLSYEEFILSI